jgi:sugar lactone lactonase YvrE
MALAVLGSSDRMKVLVLVAGLAAACNGTSAATQSELAGRPPPAADTTAARRNTAVRIALPGDATGIAWDDRAGALLVTDDTHHALARLDGEHWRDFARFPPVAHASLGGLVRLPDGRFVTPSFGFGSDGGVFLIQPDGATRALPGLDTTRRRSAVARGDDGTLYVGYFVVEPGKAQAGGVARLDLAGRESDVIGGLGKPVGLAVARDTLYVADEDRGALLAYSLVDPALGARVVVSLPGAHLLTLLPGGDLVTGGRRGEVYRVTPAGRLTVIADGFEHVRGTAYDAAGKRLFVIEHSAASSRHILHILPLDS